MGLDEDPSTPLPKWKRGHFSILFDGGTQPSRAFLVDWGAETYVDLQKEKKDAKMSPDAEVSPDSEGTCLTPWGCARV